MTNSKIIINGFPWQLIPLGFCKCGCGGRTTIPLKSSNRDGQTKGVPCRFIRGHSKKGANHHSWKGGRRKKQGYVIVWSPGHPQADSQGCVLESRMICEKALGKALPDGAIIHHVNGIKDDNCPGNLVVCQDRVYHHLLHQRQRAYAACGNPNWRKCYICKQYDDPKNLYLHIAEKGSCYHRICYNEKRKAAYRSKRLRLSELNVNQKYLPEK